MNKTFIAIIICFIIFISPVGAAEVTSGIQKQFDTICAKCNLDCLNKYERYKLYKVDEPNNEEQIAIFFDHVTRGSSNREFYIYLFDGSSCKVVLKNDAASASFKKTSTLPNIVTYWHAGGGEDTENTYFWNGKEYEDVHYRARVAKRNELNNEALLLFKQGNMGQAISKWKEVEKHLAPYDAEILNNIGFAYYEMARNSKNTTDYSNADEYLQKALRVEPDRWTALLNAGDLEYDVGYFIYAMRHYEKLLQVKPDYKYADKIRSRIKELRLEPKEIGIEVTVDKYYFKKRHITYTRIDKDNVLRREYYFESGNISRTQNLTDGIENGEFRSWNAAGDLQTVGQMEMGKKVGKWIEYYPNGNIKQVLTYKADGTVTDVTGDYVKN